MSIILLKNLKCWNSESCLGNPTFDVEIKRKARTKIYNTKISQGQASGMDGTLTVIFAISKTIRDSKKFIIKH